MTGATSGVSQVQNSRAKFWKGSVFEPSEVQGCSEELCSKEEYMGLAFLGSKPSESSEFCIITIS